MPKKKVEEAEVEQTEAEEVQTEATEQEAEVEQPVAEQEAPKAAEPDEGRVSAGGKAERMREALAKEPKVRVLVPLADGEKPGVTQSVILNGYSLYIRKGEYVDVPQSVAEVLEIKMKHKMSVENHPLRMTGTGEVKLDVY